MAQLAERTHSYEIVPREMTSLPRWVVWRREPNRRNPGEFTKVPYQARRPAFRASSSDEKTWGSFDEAVSAVETVPDLSGIGFVVTKADGIVGVDIDHCRDRETGDVSPEACEIMASIDSYAEVTPSGTGIRIFAFGALPPKDRKNGDYEMYESGRFLTVTGHHVQDSPTSLRQRSSQILAMHTKYLARGDKGQKAPASIAPALTSDDRLLERARAARNGSAFRLLFDHGDTSSYPSASEADAALCAHLAFWCARDAVTVDRLFRRSALMRDKWDARRGAESYGAATVARACALSSSAASGKPNPPAASETKEAERTRWRLDELRDRPGLLAPPVAVVPRVAWPSRCTLFASGEDAATVLSQWGGNGSGSVYFRHGIDGWRARATSQDYRLRRAIVVVRERARNATVGSAAVLGRVCACAR